MPKEYDWNFLRGLGRQIAAFRKRAGLSQESLAEKTNLHRTYIGFIEQGKRDPSIGNLHRIATALDVELEDIFASPKKS